MHQDDEPRSPAGCTAAIGIGNPYRLLWSIVLLT